MYFYTLISRKILKDFWDVQFYTKWGIYVWKGLSLVVLLISNTGRLKSFFFNVSIVSYVFLYADFGKINQQNVYFIHNASSLCCNEF